jgi:hypothetical protein
MATSSVRFREGRKLFLSSVAVPEGRSPQSPFVALLPAYSAVERQQAEAVCMPSVKLGCVEFCCVGPESELLHDALDAIVEAEGALGVVTTWVEEPTEAVEYFLHAAGGGRPDLLAMVDAHPDLRDMLRREALCQRVAS